MAKRLGRPHKSFFSKVDSSATKSALKKAQKRKSNAKSIQNNNLNTRSKNNYFNDTPGKIVNVFSGFSFTAFFFAPIWCLLKGLYLYAILSFVLSFIMVGLVYWIVLGVKGNEWYKEDLVKKGYYRLGIYLRIGKLIERIKLIK